MQLDYSKIKDWQSLIGAFVGAFLPISFALFLRWRDSKRKYISGIGKIENFLAYSINEIYEIREGVELFIDRIKEFRKSIELNKGNNFALDSTNFPVEKIEYEKDIFENKTKSLYLINKLMMCHLMLKNINNSLAEIREEYQTLKMKNYDMVLSGKVTVQNQNQLRIDQLIATENILENAFLEKNIPIMVNSLLEAKILLIKYLKPYGFFYRIYYEGFFRNVSQKEGGQKIIEDKLREETRREFEKIEKKYQERIYKK